MSRSRSSRIVPTFVGLVPLTCVLGMIVIVAIAGLTWSTSPYYGRNDALPPAINVGTIPSRAVTPAATRAANARPVDLVSPRRIVIPKLQAKAPVVKVGTTPDGELDVPLNPKVVGWWSPGAKPGATQGTAILAGHINYAGVTGTLADIGTLKPGDEVDVFGFRHGHSKKVRFTVTGVRTYHKSALPYKQIFSQSVAGRLAIVTCGGPFDASTGNYLDNIVTFAKPATS